MPQIGEALIMVVSELLMVVSRLLMGMHGGEFDAIR